MAQTLTIHTEHDEHGYYAWCSELEGCQTQGESLAETLTNIGQAIELYWETLSVQENVE
ncbi:MAG: type II toxin-antitoxin system HicB family antitoxin [Candidatus Hydrogenedentota bacterium]